MKKLPDGIGLGQWEWRIDKPPRFGCKLHSDRTLSLWMHYYRKSHRCLLSFGPEAERTDGTRRLLRGQRPAKIVLQPLLEGKVNLRFPLAQPCLLYTSDAADE